MSRWKRRTLINGFNITYIEHPNQQGSHRIGHITGSFLVKPDGQSSAKSRYEAITFKHLLLPVWLLAYRYKDKPYRVVVNACTGEVQGERPYSWVKITFTVLAALLAAGTVAALMQS